ncbi:MAG: hypothetical protein Q7R51_01260 [bacterium]|nr:hypothetical protein [bacterium]
MGLKESSIFRAGVGLAAGLMAVTAYDSLQLATTVTPTLTWDLGVQEANGAFQAFSSEYQITFPYGWHSLNGKVFEMGIMCSVDGQTPVNPILEIDTKPVKKNFNLDHFKKATILSWKDEVRTAVRVGEAEQDLARMVVDVQPAFVDGVEALRVAAKEPNLVFGLGRTRVSYLIIKDGKAVSIGLKIPPFYDNTGNDKFFGTPPKFIAEFDQIASSFHSLN